MRRLGTPSAFEGPRPGAGGEEVPLRGSSVLAAQTPRAPAAPLLPRARPGGVRTPNSLRSPRPRNTGSFPKGWRGARAHSRARGSRRAARIQTSAWWSGQGNCKSSSARPTLTRHASQGGCEGHLSDPAESSSPLRVVRRNPGLHWQPRWAREPQSWSERRGGCSGEPGPKAPLPRPHEGGSREPGARPPNPPAPSAHRDARRLRAGVRPRASLPDLMEL